MLSGGGMLFYVLLKRHFWVHKMLKPSFTIYDICEDLVEGLEPMSSPLRPQKNLIFENAENLM